MYTALETEHASCSLCNSTDKKVVYAQFPPPYKVVQCSFCGFYYLSPRLTEEASLEMYKDDSYFEGKEGGYESYREQERSLQATFRRFMGTLQKHGLTGGRLLEVGCGYGYFLEEARGFFDVRFGMDFSNRACEEAAKKADDIYCGGIEQVPHSEKFDCIVAINVIEHVYDPKAFIEKLRQHLNPNGKMVIATPDMGSFWRLLMRHRWPSFKIPEHILYFDKNSLSDLMKQAGLTGIRPLSMPHSFPLSLIAETLHLKLPGASRDAILWLPKIMVALYGGIE